MSVSEFDIIERFFHWPCLQRPEVRLSVGDDAAELALSAHERLVLQSTQYLEGVDFHREDSADSVAHRLLAKAASSLAACGAKPFSFTLALSMPAAASEDWLQAFSRGLENSARTMQLALIGGDTTRGPRAAVLHVHGTLPDHIAPTPRTGAAPGDLVYVTGQFGDAALALLHETGELQLIRADREAATRALRFPDVNLASGSAAAGIARCARAIDTSLMENLAGMLADSGCGATVQAHYVPLGPATRNNLERAGGWNLPWNGPAPGTLCFIVPAAEQARFERALQEAESECTWIGLVERSPGLRCYLEDGSAL